MLVLIVISVYTLNSDADRIHSTYIFLTFFNVAGQAFAPVWFYQGIEKTWIAAKSILIGRLASLIIIFIIVKNSSHVNYIPIINGVTSLISTLHLYLIMSKFGFIPKAPSYKKTFSLFREANKFFWSRAAVSCYSVGGSILIANVNGIREVAVYSACEQIYRAGQSLISPLSQALYPYMVKSKDINLLLKIMLVMLVASLVFGGVAMNFSDKLLGVVYGKEFVTSAEILNILIVGLIFGVQSSVIGYPFLGAFGRNDLANNSILVAGSLQVIMLSFLWIFNKVNPINVASCVLLSEISLFLVRAKFGIDLIRDVKKGF